MAIGDIFKRKKGVEKTDRPKAEAMKTEAEVSRPVHLGSVAKRPMGFVLIPHITEKSAKGQEHGWYVFKVRSNTNKSILKRAVEGHYGVAVERVHSVNQRSKAIRLGRTLGETPGFKKVMVKLKVGQKIEFT